jgi:hypothetical protein
MVEEIVGNMAAFNPATTVYDHATVYTLDDPESPAIPQAGISLSIVGAAATPGWTRAVQRCWVFRDTEWQVAKLYQLDTASTNDFDAVSDITGVAAALALTGSFTSTSWAWASRNGERPATFMKATLKLNDKLRREYGMD